MRFHLTTALAATLALTACAGESDDAATDVDTSVETADVAADTDMDVDVATGDDILDPNSATAEQLTAIDGIDMTTAESIVNGAPYADAVAFNTMLVEAVGEEQAAMIRERLFVPIDLNSASEEAIALVPGIDDRMVHEFLEYRPYQDLEEFDREIGKYVDEAEVARFRQYVTL